MRGSIIKMIYTNTSRINRCRSICTMYVHWTLMNPCKRKSYEKFVYKVECPLFLCPFFFLPSYYHQRALLGIPDSMNYSAIVNHGTSSARKTNVSGSQKELRENALYDETHAREVIDLCCVSREKRYRENDCSGMKAKQGVGNR